MLTNRWSLIIMAAGLAVVIVLQAAVASTARADDETVSWSLPTTSSLTVNPGDTVTWTFADSLPHTVTSLSGPETFDSGQLSGSGQSFAFTFDDIGTYTYQCGVHGSSMSGTVVVQAAGGAATATATSTATQPATSTPTATQPAAATPTPTQPVGATSPTPQPPATGSGTGGGSGSDALTAGALVASLFLVAGAAAFAASRRS
jgi:plastocyanin